MRGRVARGPECRTGTSADGPECSDRGPCSLPFCGNGDGTGFPDGLKKRFYGGSHRNIGYDLARRRADLGGLVYRAREAEHRASVARRTACRPDRGSLGPGFRRRVRVGAAYRPLGRGTRFSRPGGGFGFRRRRSFAAVDRRCRMPRDESACQRFVAPLRVAVAQDARAARGRYLRGDRGCLGRGHRGQSLSGGLVERHALFQGLRLRDDRRAARSADRAFHDPRYARRARSRRVLCVLPRDGRALSGTAFRLPCPQRLRSGRGECHGRYQGGRTGNPYDRQRAGGAGRQRAPVERCGCAERPSEGA